MTAIEENAVYTPKESQELLKISPSTMTRMIKKGLIRAAKVGKQYRIMGKELLRVLSPAIEDRVGRAYNKARHWVHKDIDE
jgi:excisionase family DNA binding protein